MVGFTVAQAGIEQENIKGFGIGAKATLVKYESAIKSPIPFMDKKLQIWGISIAWNTRGIF